MANCNRRISPDQPHSTLLLALLAGSVSLWYAGGAWATAHNPLEPIDTLSPQAARQGFIQADPPYAQTAHPLTHGTIGNTDTRIALLEPGPRVSEPPSTAESSSRIHALPDQVPVLSYLTLDSPATYGMPDYRSVAQELVSYQVIAALDFPDWAETRIRGEPLWRWLGTCLVLLAGLTIIAWSFMLSRRWAGRETLIGHWSELLRPLSMVLVTPALAAIIAEVLRVPGAAGKGLTLMLWTVFFVALTWLVWVSGTLGAENFIRREQLPPDSIDSRIVRGLVRLVTTALAIAILAEGLYMVGHSMLPGSGADSMAVPGEATRFGTGKLNLGGIVTVGALSQRQG